MNPLHIEWDARVPMRDGVELSADIYLPPDFTLKKQYPALLMRTPYLKSTLRHVEVAKYFAYHDYIFVFQDVRGRGDSDGDFHPFQSERWDGYDSVEWVAAQPWSNGKVGMLGGSYLGYVQWAAARDKPPHLVTFVSTAPGGKLQQELPFFNGIPALGMIAWLQSVGGRSAQEHAPALIDWSKVYLHTPLLTMDEVIGRIRSDWREWITHPGLDDFWKPHRLTEEDFRNIDLPILHITGWYDGDQAGAMFFYKGMIDNSPAAERQKIIIGPWSHKGTWYPTAKLWGQEFTDKAVLDMMEIHRKWFDFHLKGERNDVETWAPTKYFMMGENDWFENTSHWPVNAKTTQMYLHSEGKANTIKGNGHISPNPPQDEPYDEYLYDPEKPNKQARAATEAQKANQQATPKNSEPTDATLSPKYTIKKIVPQPEPSEEEGSMDIAPYLGAEDVLVYTSEPFSDPLKIAGNPYIEFFASSNCKDTDWFVALMDVEPDGKSIYITNRMFGMLRARYRNSLETPELLEPNKIYKYRIELAALGRTILPGHRLRLAITSSGFPEWARNHNTGNDIALDTEFQIATNRIYHDMDHPAVLHLPLQQ